MMSQIKKLTAIQLRQQILSLLEDRDRMTIGQIREALHVKRPRVSLAIAAMQKTNEIVSVKRDGGARHMGWKNA